jgi:hypothetical protein
VTNDQLAKLNFSGWPLRDDYVMEVGRVALLWAGLENFLMTCIGKLAGLNKPLDERAYILLAHSTFPQRLDNFAALCALLKDEFPQLGDYEDVVSLLKTAQKARNRFVHNGAFFDEDTGSFHMAVGSARGNIKTRVDQVSVEDVKRACVQIDAANRALYKLVLKRDLPPAWQART